MGRLNGESKGIEYGHRPPTLWADLPCDARKAVSGVAQLQNEEGRISVSAPVHSSEVPLSHNQGIGTPWKVICVK
jgi:hypothetical protein